jgi:hypothetical protein
MSGTARQDRLLIYGNEEALSQELSGSGELADAYGVAGQVNGQVVRAADGVPRW